MELMRKINQNVMNRGKSGINPLFERFRNEFRYMLSAGAGGAGLRCIRDEHTINELTGVLKSPMDSVTVFVGKKGNGKTLDLQESYGCNNNAITLRKDDRTVVIPMFFHGLLAGKETVSREESADRIKRDIERQVAAASRKIEKENSVAGEWFHQEGRDSEFCDFIQNSNPKALENPNDWENESVEEMLETAKETEYFIYAASKLKFHLAKGPAGFDRVLILIDGVESLDESVRDLVISQYLRFYECMRNFPVQNGGRRVYVNLVISLRPNTYYTMKAQGVFENYDEAFVIYKEYQIDLSEYFREKVAKLPEEVRTKDEVRWNEALRMVTILTEKFEKKYSNMIMGLTDLNLRYALKVCEDILSNPVWVTRAARTDPNVEGMRDEYVFNNITVLRAIACGSDLVYMGGEDNLIPNVLYNTPECDNALISLYIIAYFVKRYEYSGQPRAVGSKRKDVWRDFEDVFGEQIDGIGEFKSRFEETVSYLLRCGVLGGTDDDMSITSKGREIYNMLAADSVLMELYREDYYKIYNSSDAEGFKSSFDLMQEDKQEFIFKGLLEMMWHLLEREKNVVKAAKRKGAYNKYVSLFGNESMTGHLLSGVNKSVDYSGKYQVSEVQEERTRLAGEISNMMNAD
ncbi:MAG: hypothetical protein HFH25_13135 [Lachnospiraceae bacterium]|nr:hypothetical protein [Lachnospiraceae bacterium]